MPLSIFRTVSLMIALGFLAACSKDSTDNPEETGEVLPQDTGQSVDADGDHYTADEDCDDSDPNIHPGANEVCDENQVDEDCDGLVNDEDSNFAEGDRSTWYQDADEDGHGDLLNPTLSCEDPSTEDLLYVEDASDCDDNNADIHPNADETCNDVDDDCDGEIDESPALDASLWYIDNDGDGYGDISIVEIACNAPSGHVSDDTDCDDTDASVHPGAMEFCDNEDDNCDGEIDEDSALDASTWYADTDSDGYGDGSSILTQCEQPSGYVSDDSDCDDNEATTNPSADEYCDGHDDDCDGDTDEDSAVDASTWYADSDNDAYGDPSSTDIDCYQPTGYVADNSDCDDTDATLNGDDNDNDGFSTCDGDCDDNDIDLDPADNDADGLSTCDGDCNDSNSSAGICYSGQVYQTTGAWTDVKYAQCGSGTNCTAPDAKAACVALGLRVVSHASNGTSEVVSLGATNSCNHSISYYTVEESMASSQCLAGISNLEWSSCCTTVRWHGNTLGFGAANTVFGWVSPHSSGHSSSYTNSSPATTWGCYGESTNAGSGSNCSSLYVACMP